jgi:hypothetical protein
VLLLTALLAGCGGGGNSAGLGLPGTTDGSGGTQGGGLLYEQLNGNTFPSIAVSVAEPDSPYSDVLIDCVILEQIEELCSLITLPFIVQETSSPTIDDILDRTVVSHDWMAERFRQLLERFPPELLSLFQATTAVVISADIRPAFYTSLTGAIYIDPSYLWLTNDEKYTILTEEDFRAGYGNDLNLVPLWRYLEGNDYAWEYYSLFGTETRSISDIVRPAAALFFHELAHANDVIPPALVGTLDPALTVLEADLALRSSSTSEQLNAYQPLNSQLWQDLGQVLFRGEIATAALRSVTAQEAGVEFQVDGANDAYNYASIYEDTAMLFEEVMMKYHYGIDREVAFTDAPSTGEALYCDSYVIRWGYRNRVNDPLVRSRAEFVLQQLLGESDVSAYLAGFSGPRKLTNGLDWCTVENLSIVASSFSAESAAVNVAEDSRELLRPDSRQRSH